MGPRTIATMKHHLSIAAGLALASTASAQVLVTDDFSYTGALTANGWTAHSGAGNKEIQSDGAVATLDFSSGSGEDVNLAFAPLAANDDVYASFVLNVPSGNPVNPDNNGSYFAHFKDASFGFRGRFGLLSPAASGDFQVAINASSSSLGGGGVWPSDLLFDTNYTIVISYDAATGESKLWVDPVDASSASVAHTGTAGTLIESIALRQAADHTGFITVDDVVVGNAFLDVVPATTGGGSQTRVQILHASDLEGGVDAIQDAPNFAAIVEGLEADAASAAIPSLLLSGGDNFIPGPFFSAAGDFSLSSTFRSVLGQPDARSGEGRADISIMNLLGFDASAVGNHEFDAGTNAYGDIIGTDIRNNFTEARWLGAQFPYLSANLDFSADPNLGPLYTGATLPNTDFQSSLTNLVSAAAAPKLAPATTVTRGGVTFGIVGATTPILASITSNGGVAVQQPGAGTNDMAALAGIVQPTIDALTSQGIDKIILVSHLQQFALEQELITLLDDVDIVIAGGSGTLLADAGDRLRSGDVAAGTYPAISATASGDPALLVTTAGSYNYVGRLVVDFDASGFIDAASIQTAESGAYATDDQGVIDLFGNLTTPFQAGTDAAAVQTLTSAVSAIVSARDGNIVGRADVYLEGRRAAVRTRETNMGNLTADANLFVAQSYDSTVLVSHKNGGGIRNPIGSVGANGELGPNVANPISGKLAGEISQLDVENTLRFNNGLVLQTLTRQQFREVLEHAVADAAPGATPGSFGQWSGVSFSYDLSQPVGSRIRYAALSNTHDRAVVVEDGVVLHTDPIRMVTLDFLANGGDGYSFDAYAAADPAFADRVDLENAGLPAGAATFATAGSEQDAFAEYMLANYATSPFALADRQVANAQRVQQIGTRPGFTVVQNQPSTRDFALTGVDGGAFVWIAIGYRSGHTQYDLGLFGDLENGLDTFLQYTAGVTTSNSPALTGTWDAPFGGLLHFIGQAQVFQFDANGLSVSTSEAAAFSL